MNLHLVEMFPLVVPYGRHHPVHEVDLPRAPEAPERVTLLQRPRLLHFGVLHVQGVAVLVFLPAAEDQDLVIIDLNREDIVEGREKSKRVLVQTKQSQT